MKYLKKGSMLLVIFFCLGFSSNQDKSSPKDNPVSDWNLIINKYGVQVYSKWVITNQGIKTRILKGEFTVNRSENEMIQLIKQQKSWMKGLNEYRIIEDRGNDWCSYAQFSLPWPFNNKELISQAHVEYHEDSIHIDCFSRSDLLANKTGVSRIENFEADWDLVRLSVQELCVQYSAFTANEPEFPRWIQDPIVQKTFFNSLLELKKSAEMELITSNQKR